VFAIHEHGVGPNEIAKCVNFTTLHSFPADDLPIFEDHEKASSGTARRREFSKSGGVVNTEHPRLLIVDDDPALRRMLTGTLTRWGYDVIVAGDGAEALLQFRAHQGGFSAIVSDVDMPGMNGLEFARAVRQAGFEGRIVIMSGRLSVDELRDFTSCRIGGFFSKPFDLGLLATMLSRPQTPNNTV
jgi:CheY-like chemotaxis protein